MRRPSFAPILLLSLLSVAAHGQQDVRIGVLGLFHPHELAVEQDGAEAVSVTSGGPTVILNGEPGHERIVLHAERGQVRAGGLLADAWTAAARNGSDVGFRLVVPDRFTRVYRGRLTVTAQHGELVAFVAMDRETAVASIVASELAAGAPIEAMKAQAVAARSYLAAGARHKLYDFCDTTHCQYLRSPPPAGSKAWRAARETSGLVLEYHARPLAAMYSSRCGGRTRSLQEVGMDPAQGYPYYSVRCSYCRRHSVKWQSWIADGIAAPEPGKERRRIEQARQWGWGAVPGSDFTAAKEKTGWRLDGHSIGHGVGMCQYGAVGMAASGATFREILSHYYPNAELIEIPQTAANR